MAKMTMIMSTNDFLMDERNLVKNPAADVVFRTFGISSPKKRRMMLLADGTELSVQVSSGHYCTPREDNASHYNAVEIGYPSKEIPEIAKYEDDPGIYAYVPVEILDEVIKKRGGIVLYNGTEESNTSG